MATADSVKAKIQNLITKANETTGKSDTDLTSGVDSLIGKIVRFRENSETDDTVAYSKDVPENALPFAEVNKIGGMTRKCTNLIPFPYTIVDGDGRGQVTWTLKDNGAIVFNGWWGYEYVMNILFTAEIPLKAGNYWLSNQTTGNGNLAVILQYYNSSGTLLYIYSGKSFTVETDTVAQVMFQLQPNATYNDLTIYPMLNKGTEQLPYETYFEGLRSASVTEVESVGANETVIGTLPIPAEVQALDGYGWGINESVYNYIDWEKKQFVKRVEKIVFNGAEDWELQMINANGICNFGTNISKKADVVNKASLCNLLERDFTLIADATKEGYMISPGALYVRSKTYNTVSDFKSYLAEMYENGNPLTISYVIVTPIITDISDLLPDDNLIGVEGGGTVTMLNEYGYDVPSEIIFALKGEESSGSGLAINGTLKQYRVDDGAVVNAGDFVSLVPRYGSGEFVSAVKYIGSCSISAQKKVVIYHDLNLSAVMAQIVSVDDEVVFSTPVEICETSTETSVDYVYVIALTPNRLVATHYRTMRELILDGDTITFGAELEFDYPIDDITQLNENLFAISYGYRGSDSKSAYVKCETYKISGGEFVSVATKTIRSVTSNSSANYYYSNSSLDKLNDSYLIATGCIRKSSTDVAFGATVYAFTDEGLTSICSYTETMEYDSGNTEQFMRVRRLTNTSAMFTCRIGDYCYAYHFTHNDASLKCIQQQLDSSVNTSEIIGIGENKALLVHNGTSFSILTVDTDSSTITLGSTVSTNYATFYGKTGLEPIGENSVLAFVNKGAGGFVTINIENDVITLAEDTYSERGTFVKPATSYFNDVGVAATSGSAGATVSVYVVG